MRTPTSLFRSAVLALLAWIALFNISTAGAQALPAPTLAASAWILVDHFSGQELVAVNADKRVEPASLTKLMTAYLTFGALKQGKLKLDQTIPVSEKAWKTDGSKMFIEPRKPVTVDELIHGMIIQSGNDACIALAESIAGSEDAFVAMMNREAQRLGLKDTHFMNATGLPDPQHYSTARDLSLLARAIIRDFPEFYPLYSNKSYTYNKITQPNRNRLLWLDPTVDGMKTGHTDSAGYCLIASSKRGLRRLVSVVLGTESDNARAQESLKLLNHGYLAFDAYKLYDKGQAISKLKVFKGRSNTVGAGFSEDFVVSLPKGVPLDRLKVQLKSRQPLVAPVAPGAPVGSLKLILDDKPLGEFPVQALEDVPVAGLVGRTWDAIKLFFQ
jgi:D-alanyl-D-alanine carboxypeptidase (penicillin-binding protein 5/6)